MLKPLGDRIVIEQIESEEKTASGIVLPDSAKEKPQEGKVVAVGAGRVADNGERIALREKARAKAESRGCGREKREKPRAKIESWGCEPKKREKARVKAESRGIIWNEPVND